VNFFVRGFFLGFEEMLDLVLEEKHLEGR